MSGTFEILWVDEEFGQLGHIGRIMEEFGEVSIASSTLEAIASVKARVPNLIIAELCFPKGARERDLRPVEGLILLAKLRKMGIFEHTRLVLLTSVNDLAIYQIARTNSGLRRAQILQKPVRDDELRAVLTKMKASTEAPKVV